MTEPSHLQSRTSPSSRFSYSLLSLFLALIVLIGFVVAARFLPVAQAIHFLEETVARMGIWGPIVFAAIYIVAVVLLLPAWWLTVSAGALFGLLGGTFIASFSSTLGAGLAFLVARHMARGRVTQWLHSHPRLSAIDQAVTIGGWKIVGLLRLSPAVPFNLQNYLYGITGISFWPCVLTSWVAMLPGTFMYVYLGHVGRAGLEATLTNSTRTPLEWAMMATGLAATVIVTVYITRLARQAVRKQSALAQESQSRDDAD